MKKKLILFLTLFTTLCNAQIVNIPDANFKNALINSFCVDADSNWLYESDVDLNNDGQIQASEAALVQRLDISGKNISDLAGIQSFTNLKILDCHNNKLTTVDFSSNLKLQQLACSDNNFVSLTIKGLPLLTTLFICPNTSLQNLTITNNPSLTTLSINDSFYPLTSLVNLNCSSNALTSIDITANIKLSQVDCSKNRLTSIQVGPNINTLDVSNNLLSDYYLAESNISNLNISNNKLTMLSVFNCYNLSSLNYSGNPDLVYLFINNTNISSLSVHDQNNLQILGCGFSPEYGGTKLTSLQAYNLPSLVSIGFDGNDIGNIVVADFPKLTDINYSSNPNINLTLSNLPLITELSVYTSNSITIASMPNLTKLSFGTSCNNIHIINNALLKSIFYDQSFVNQFELKNAPALTDIFFNSGQTIPYNLNLTSLPGLTSLRLFITDSCNLNLTDLPDLYQVEIHDVTHFNFHDLPKLYSITSEWGELTNFSVSNLPNLHELTFDHNKLVSLNLENLPNLYTVNVEENRITNLVLNNLPQLHDISFVYNPYGQTSDTYKFSNLPKLHDLNLTSTSVGNILLNDLPGLYTISIGNDNVDTLIFSDLPTLHDVQISCSNLSSVIFSHLDSLYNLKLYSKNLQGIDINNLPNLYNLTINYCENIAKKAINLSDLPNLYKLSLSNNNLSTFSFNNVLPKLSELDFSLNNLVSLDLSKLPELRNLDISNINLYLENLDLSSNPKISTISYSEGWYHDKLKYINLRNGGNNIKSIIVGPSVKNICVDDEAEKNSLLSLNSWLAYTDFTTYCSFNPAGTFYTLQGTNLLDINNNGCDAGDISYPMINFNVTRNNDGITSTYFANNTGNYSIPFTAGQYTLTPQFENPAYYTFSPSSVNIDFPTQSSPLIQNFCISPNGNHNDLEITLLPSVPARPGFDASYVLVYKNKGNQVQSGNINLGFDDSVLNFVSASQTVSTQITDLLNWTFSNLKPFESRTITITFKVNTTFVHPPVVSGSILNYNSEIIGLTDENPGDNVSNLHQTVVNSFDPNDKTCLEGKNVATDLVGEYVHYMIRFQNTGTANAKNIVVKDSIDLTKFDLSTLIPINGSHSFYTRISDSNQVEFIFENINLPYNSGANNGYISFKIKTKPDLVFGDSFSNQVNIYFDYNNPIETTNYVSTIQSSGITNFESKEAISTIFPNPVRDILQFTTIEKVTLVEVYDLSGRILSSNSVNENKVNLNKLIPGTYILRVYTEKGKMSIKIIKE
jgi:uncharacterized repeat protein (TIGR01451 family)